MLTATVETLLQAALRHSAPLQAAASAPAPVVHGAVDSVRMDQSPLPGGVANIFRFLFSGVPQWVQIGGVVLGAIVAIVVAVVAWKRRGEIARWLGGRTQGYKLALGAGVGTTLLAAGLAGGWTYNYMMHENDFCSSCHVMSTAFGRFQKSEHSKLECHACHQQSIYASAKELYYWVMDRPEKIPTHSPVPNKICGECHITQKRDSVWQFISATAGHQVHMQSDSTSLRDVMCVSCHAKEVHAFAPTDVSCQQSGCHDEIKVRLGRMGDQTSLHCATCHEFSRPVDALAPLDSGRQGLVPLKPQCFACHEMREKLEQSGLDKDPHQAKCGECHNPHVQETAAGAIKSCATSECHANADTLTAFHRGLPDHALDKCTACHKAHSWKVESTDCITCHRSIFDDRSATRRAVVPSAPSSRQLGGPAADIGDRTGRPWWVEDVRQSLTAQRGTPQSSAPPFEHSRHRRVACSACHSTERQHGQLMIRDAAACQACHHGKTQQAECAACHADAELQIGRAVAVSVHVTARATDVSRSLTFEHARHAASACGTCHANDVQRSVTTTCNGCHGDHHAVTRDCTACHPTPRAEHARDTHNGCAGCHTDAAVAALPPVRTLCISCHPDQTAHYATRQCVECHRVSWNEIETAPGTP